MIIIKNIKLPVQQEDRLKNTIEKIINRKDFTYEVYKRSLDARKNLIYNYQVLVECKGEEQLIKKKDIDFFSKPTLEILPVEPENKSTIVVGAGPCGIFAAYVLAKNGVKVKVIEKGYDVDTRKKDVEEFWNTGNLKEDSNVQFGEGGAGTFSDGKLTSRSKDQRMELVKEVFVKYGAPEEILYESKPHVGTDLFIDIVRNIRNGIIEMGGEFYFGESVEELIYKDGRVKGVKTTKNTHYAENIILGIGNSSRDLFTYLSKHIAIESKPLAVGFRIEHAQDMLNNVQYKENSDFGRISPATYMLTAKTSVDLGVYTFCMCPGGMVINASSEKDHLVVNGMSYHARDGKNANSAVIATIDSSIFGDHPLGAMEFQRKCEKKAYEIGEGFLAPVQRVEDFIKNVPTTKLGSIEPTVKPGYVLANLREIYPEKINTAICEGLYEMDKKLHGFINKDAILTGIESRSSSPIRILRDEKLESITLKGLYPLGEGAGYAGGIMSSALDGVKGAISILEREKC